MFVINPYDPCVANKIINGSQCTIAWYVDDKKLSHKDPAVVTDILDKIEAKFPGLVITRGKEHTFLGIKFRFRDDQKVELDLSEYIHEAIEESGIDVSQKVTTPHASWLFKVDPNAKKLDEDKKEIFHSVTQKLLGVSQRGRPDVMTTISFLCLRVYQPDVEDWKKLRRLLCFLKCTINYV